MSDSKNAMDQAFDDLEAEMARSKASRQKAIDMLEQQIDFCKPSEYDKGMMLQAKMTVLNTFDALLKSQDEASLKRIKLRLAKKDSESNGLVGQTIVNLLKSIRSSGEAADGKPTEIDHGEVMQQLQKTQEENKEKLAISSGELEQCGTTPTTEGGTPVTKEPEEKEE